LDWFFVVLMIEILNKIQLTRLEKLAKQNSSSKEPGHEKGGEDDGD